MIDHIITPCKFTPAEKQANCRACLLAMAMRDCPKCGFYTAPIITNITTGLDPSRVQMGKPAFFVSWKINGKQMYYFSAFRWSVESVKTSLETHMQH